MDERILSMFGTNQIDGHQELGEGGFAYKKTLRNSAGLMNLNTTEENVETSENGQVDLESRHNNTDRITEQSDQNIDHADNPTDQSEIRRQNHSENESGRTQNRIRYRNCFLSKTSSEVWEEPNEVKLAVSEKRMVCCRRWDPTGLRRAGN
ncbi:hypothetical protein Bhyg_12092 [Pseudolycoriella hygida]|uniref:Uncharacterized protein n=1 Tax=Pseudolycoriella hygida TaxID=35572 RepID=A0A9Q0S0Y2_9DIPT|nr:hypothetical protein Bhyg_12092 [Pseudolycoriella hygida]